MQSQVKKRPSKGVDGELGSLCGKEPPPCPSFSFTPRDPQLHEVVTYSVKNAAMFPWSLVVNTSQWHSLNCRVASASTGHMPIFHPLFLSGEQLRWLEIQYRRMTDLFKLNKNDNSDHQRGWGQLESSHVAGTRVKAATFTRNSRHFLISLNWYNFFYMTKSPILYLFKRNKVLYFHFKNSVHIVWGHSSAGRRGFAWCACGQGFNPSATQTGHGNAYL